MPEEQFKTFLEVVKTDAGLQEKLKAATDVDGVVAIAKTAGFMISAEELRKATAEIREISDEELENVAGGNNNDLIAYGGMNGKVVFEYTVEVG